MLGITRTNRGPGPRRSASVARRMPAAIDTTSFFASSLPRNSAATWAICCGLTARISTSASAATAALSVVVRPPVAWAKRSRASAAGSAASRFLPSTRPERTNPCPSAVAICPAPIIPIRSLNMARCSQKKNTLQSRHTMRKCGIGQWAGVRHGRPGRAKAVEPRVCHGRLGRAGLRRIAPFTAGTAVAHQRFTLHGRDGRGTRTLDRRARISVFCSGWL